MGTQTASQQENINFQVSSKKRITIGISDMKVSNDTNSFLITHSLGPCIGVIVYDPKIRVGGLLHFQLPTSKGHEQRAMENPFMFADTAMPRLFKEVEAHGSSRKRLTVSIFGGASMLHDDQIFKIGIQNTRVAKKIMWQHCINIKNEEIGGKSSRTVSIDIETGSIRLQMDGKSYYYN